MYSRLFLKTKAFYPLSKERLIMIVIMAVTFVVGLWIFQAPPAEKKTDASSEELSLTIPKGYSIAPIELANATALSALISQKAIVDVYESNKKTPVIENLRIIKLLAGEGPLFGALLPDKLMGIVQPLLNHKTLRGALKPSVSGETRLSIQTKKQRFVSEILTSEDL